MAGSGVGLGWAVEVGVGDVGFRTEEFFLTIVPSILLRVVVSSSLLSSGVVGRFRSRRLPLLPVLTGGARVLFPAIAETPADNPQPAAREMDVERASRSFSAA